MSRTTTHASRWLVLLIASGALALSACSDDGDVTPTPDSQIADGTSPKSDGGLPNPEGGPPVPDAQTPKQDTGGTPGKDAGTPNPDQGMTPDFGTPINPKKVAAVQYGQGQAGLVLSSCTKAPFPDVCAMEKLTADARAAGAQLVVHSEYGIDQKYYEPQPQIGENPGTSSIWPADTLIKMFSIMARKMEVYLVFDLLTYQGQKPNTKYFNTQIAFDPKGKVVGMHHKFNLFGNEGQTLTAGSDVSVFDTPMGKTGLLICADIYGSSTLLNKLSNTLGAKVVAVSSYWTVNGAVSWYKTYSGKYKVHAVVSNHTHSKGYGGGVYKPDGTPIVETEQTKPNIVYAVLP
jgi:predicted amidohydrolase